MIKKELRLTIAGWRKGRVWATTLSRKIGVGENHILIKVIGWVIGSVIGVLGLFTDFFWRHAFQREYSDILHEKKLAIFTKKVAQLEKRRTEVKTEKERLKIDKHLAKLYPLLEEVKRIDVFVQERERKR